MDAEREQDALELGVGCCGAGSVFLTADVHCVEEAGLIRLPHQRQALRDDWELLQAEPCQVEWKPKHVLRDWRDAWKLTPVPHPSPLSLLCQLPCLLRYIPPFFLMHK